MISIKGKLNI